MLRRAEFWLNVFDDKPVKSIKRSYIEKALDKYANSGKPKSNNTLLRMKSVLSGIFIYANDKKYLNKNPTEQVSINLERSVGRRFIVQALGFTVL